MTPDSLPSTADPTPPSSPDTPKKHLEKPRPAPSPSHIFLLLTDSALPLGSFAFSSGLESFLAHTTPASPRSALLHFLHLSLHTLSTSTLPFLFSVYRSPSSASELDDLLSASTLCPVTLRSSISQGRSLLTLYTKSLFSCATAEGHAQVTAYNNAIKSKSPEAPQGHFAVAWALVCSAFGLEVREAVRVFVVNFVKSLLSAGVRLGVAGPYWIHGILVEEEVVRGVEECIRQGEKRGTDEVGQGVPAWDLWQGRHEVLYSRVFNS